MCGFSSRTLSRGTMELSAFFRTLRKNWLLVLALTLLGLASATGFTATRTPTYESSSTVFVSTQAGGTALELQQGSTFAQARINTYVGLVTAPIVLDPVIAQLRLAETTETLAAKVKASATLNTTLITVTVVETDPALSAEISNSIAKTLATVVPQLEPASVDGASPIRLTLVREASVPTTPSSPNMLLNLALGCGRRLTRRCRRRLPSEQSRYACPRATRRRVHYWSPSHWRHCLRSQG